MTVKIIKYYIILLVIFFSWVNFANAGVVINEFVSNGEIEWIELLNETGNSIDITGWKLIDGNSSIKDDLDLDGIITANGLIVFESPKGWLNDSGDAIILKNNLGNTIGSITYGTEGLITAPKLNKSGALISGNWVTNQEPTKNSVNSSSSNYSDDSYEDESLEEDILVEENPEILKITTKIISPKIVTAGIPFSINSSTTTNKGETYAVGIFVWNFGDGMIKKVGKSSPFEYMYKYPGEYALTLSYYDSVFSINPDAVDKITIKVVPAGINISSVGTASDPFIEIENKSNYEIILSNWMVTAGIHNFIIPEGTTILSNKKIKLSPQITGFVGEDIKSIVITNPNKEITTTYPIQTKKSTPKISSINNTIYSNPVSSNYKLQDNSLSENSQVINLNDLKASVAEETGINISNSTYPFIGLFVVIGLGVSSFLLIKNKKDVEDYIEKGIRAEDMTIIE